MENGGPQDVVGFHLLPVEVQIAVMRFLDMEDLRRASAVCRHWRELCHCNRTLARVLRREFLFRGVLVCARWLLTRYDDNHATALRRECRARVELAVAKLGFPKDGWSAQWAGPTDPELLLADDLRMWLAEPEDGDPVTQPRINMAAVNGDTDVVLTMLECGADPDCENATNGTTAVMCAAANGQTDTVAALVELGHAQVNKTTDDGVSALMYCAQNGHRQAAELLVAAGASVSQRMNDGMSSLYFAAQDGHLEVLELLLEAGALVDVATAEGVTPLVAAATYGHDDVVRLLLECQAEPDSRDCEGWTPLLVGVRYPGVVQALLDCGADPNASRHEGTRPLLQASQGGHLESVKLLLQAGADVDGTRESDGSTALMHASEQGHPDIVALLIGTGADVNKAVRGGVTPLILAVEGAKTSTVVELLIGGADPNKARDDGTTPLIYSATYGHREIAQALVGAGADVNLPRADGITALMYASERPENDGLVVDLLTAGANPNAISSEGYSAFFPVIMAGNATTAHILIEWGADPDLARIRGMTSLAYAVSRENIGAVNLLLQCGSNVDNDSSTDGRTPLIEAVDIGSLVLVNMLLSKKSSPNIADRRGRTPLMYAAARLCKGATGTTKEIIAALLSAGADPNASTKRACRTPLLTLVASAPCPHKRAPSDGDADKSCDRAAAETLEVLLRAGANPMAARKDGVTPLMLAARNGCQRLVRILLGKPPRGSKKRKSMPQSLIDSIAEQLSRRASNSWTALHFAASSCNADCVRELLDAGADPDQLTSVRKTPLFLTLESCIRGTSGEHQVLEEDPGPNAPCICRDVVALLLSRGADPNRTSELGNSPLMAALRRKEGHIVTLVQLLDAGACVVHLNNEDCGPLSLAHSLPCHVLEPLLRRVSFTMLCQHAPLLAQWLQDGCGRELPKSSVKEAARVLNQVPECHSSKCPDANRRQVIARDSETNQLLGVSRLTDGVPMRSRANSDAGEDPSACKLPKIPAQKERLVEIARIYGVPLIDSPTSPSSTAGNSLAVSTSSSLSVSRRSSKSRFPVLGHNARHAHRTSSASSTTTTIMPAPSLNHS